MASLSRKFLHLSGRLIKGRSEIENPPRAAPSLLSGMEVWRRANMSYDQATPGNTDAAFCSNTTNANVETQHCIGLKKMAVVYYPYRGYLHATAAKCRPSGK